MDRMTLLVDNLKALGAKKLAALGMVFVLVVAIVSVAAYFLSRPTFEILYAGLDREDVSRIGAALKSSGVAFDVNPEGNTVSVPYGQTAQARMLLAERGLPQSANAGYELFDKVGALGLTSFMQEVTRVRALEGDLRMSRQEIKEELKQSEGDPYVKARMRSLAMDRSRRRMIAAVPDASFVIANPTHYAIALRYVREEGGAPLVLAKGKDLVALKIREIAERNGVPVLERKELARAMFDLVEVDRMIPQEFYRPIAELIHFLDSFAIRRH